MFHQLPNDMASTRKLDFRPVTVWVHDDNFSEDEVLIAPDILGKDGLPPNALMEIAVLKPSSDHCDTRNSQIESQSSGDTSLFSASKVSKGSQGQPVHLDHESVLPKIKGQNPASAVDPRTRYFFIAKPMPPDIRLKHPSLQVSITGSIANRFGYRQRSQALIALADKRAWSASHVELVIRDEYLSRSDMWRLVRSELAGKTVHKGQKIQFLATIKAVVKSINIHGRTVSSAYFCGTTVPVFRSESARYVLFIQMSREMWDFDSEGTGEIMFSRVIDGFLPELFKRWVELEARHLVSIVLFGRLEYDRQALAALQRLNFDDTHDSSIDIDEKASCRDFYRVVVTDMASGQWTTILNELKKDFRVFLRDITLHQPREHQFTEGYIEPEDEKDSKTRICSRPTSALRGNILEAINIASYQFASDYIDRDLVRTGISVVVITPGTGLFEVDRQLLDLTSENLTSNGIGIHLVCLSKMPLHSVPLFKWHRIQPKFSNTRSDSSPSIQSLPKLRPVEITAPVKVVGSSSPSESTPREKGISIVTEPQWSFGIPQWIDVCYWASGAGRRRGSRGKRAQETTQPYLNPRHTKKFVPRVRMYEVQMMGLMELGLANISIPYLSDFRQKDGNTYIRRGERLSSRRTSKSAAGGRGLLSVQAKQQGDMYDRMDAYDRNLFSVDASLKAAHTGLRRKKANKYATSPEQDSQQKVFNPPRRDSVEFDTSDTDTIRSIHRQKSVGSQALSSQAKSVQGNTNITDSRISRSISFALRGLGSGAPRAVASTEINIENAQAEHSGPNLQSHFGVGKPPKNLKSPADRRSKRLSMLSVDSEESSELLGTGRLAPAPVTSPSRPILIKNTVNLNQNSEKTSNNDFATPAGMQYVPRGTHDQVVHLQLEDPKVVPGSGETGEGESNTEITVPASASEIPPWIKHVNPTNPSRNRPKVESWAGSGKHLFPRGPKTSTVNWKSLCTPASVPLTTEEFPGKEDWDHQYLHSSYIVSANNDSGSTEVPKSREWLLREMIGLRLCHGYQLVVGRGVADVVGLDAAESADYLMPEKLAQDGAIVFMSTGNTIQKLLCIHGAEVQVTRYVRRTPEATQEGTKFVAYSPVIRTILSKSYFLRKMTLVGFPQEYPWRLADLHIAGLKDDLTKVYEELRYWRARFVVIPVEPPPCARRPVQSTSEDNEEEIHLLGIHELTKMWQKIRYTPPEERGFRPTPGKRKDPNPLEIIYQTLNPSEVVATEIEKLLVTDEGADPRQIQLLPDSELLERSTATVSKIAQVLQSEKGVEITNRRWHLRLHYSCFKGDDFTNWLISNFKDIDGRDEAVEFGNELMQHGLFHHVSTRHNFKDGNYFYTIAPEHRIPRPESRSSWFASGRRPDRSVPATPVADSGFHTSPLSSQSQSGWNSTRHADTRGSEKGNSEKRQVSVSLTKMMRIDVDHRNPKRSDRQEIVNLHYDRLHNPENCYHLELSWLNVTSKLIEDAIVNWATQLEKYGLRLVEVPIAEACSITDREPFRAPYRIVLKVRPPPSGNVMVGNGTSYFTNSSFAPHIVPSVDKLIYQKALLKKFNFVLDLEAASEFPPDVDVTYTWGRLGYRYPQFVHRSGVILAQITDDGELLLLANRLYNTRPASTKDATGKFELKNSLHNRPMPSSSTVGLNTQNSSPRPSPLERASSDVLGSSNALSAREMAAFITPEQIKDELEDFCHDGEKLKAFFQEISERGPQMSRKSGSSSSSVLRPVPEYGLENSIPDLRLPASVITTATAAVKSLGMGLTKKSSPQPARRENTETVITDTSRRASADSH